MKIIEAITRIDSLKHNTYTEIEKVAWLSELDSMVKFEIMDAYDVEVAFNGYDSLTDTQKELLITAPFEKAYLLWLEAQIDYYNGEYEKYNNAMEMFNTAYAGFKNYYNRTHMPKGKKFKFF